MSPLTFSQLLRRPPHDLLQSLIVSSFVSLLLLFNAPSPCVSLNLSRFLSVFPPYPSLPLLTCLQCYVPSSRFPLNLLGSSLLFFRISPYPFSVNPFKPPSQSVPLNLSRFLSVVFPYLFLPLLSQSPQTPPHHAFLLTFPSSSQFFSHDMCNNTILNYKERTRALGALL